MATFTGSIKYRSERNRSSSFLLAHSPFCNGIVLRALIRTPNNPNSAKRKIVQFRVKCGGTTNWPQWRSYFASIPADPGHNHSLREYSRVLISGGNLPDIPAVYHRCVAGKYDFEVPKGRVNAPSNYGLKNYHIEALNNKLGSR